VTAPHQEGSAVTVREPPGLSAKGQPINVDAGLPQLVLSEHLVEAPVGSRSAYESEHLAGVARDAAGLAEGRERCTCGS
jgi:hypothetical protein